MSRILATLIQLNTCSISADALQVPGPTRGANESQDRSWVASRYLPRVVGAALFLAPLVSAWLAVRYLGGSLYNPPGVTGLIIWLIQAAVLASLVAAVVDRGARRLLPLRALLGMSLTFPDHAPSRFGIALRAGTLSKLESKVAELSNQGAQSTQQAATLAVELVTMLGKHERMTRGHTERVRAYSDLIAEEMRLSIEDRGKLAWAALLHDIGKLTVPAEILNKETRPTPQEWEVLAGHPAAGANMLEPLHSWLGEWLLATAEHHERWDGDGYPQNLAGNEISLAGRIVAVADAYDVITSRRSYKQPLSSEAARRELVQCAGHQFDPDVVRAMLSASSSSKTRSARFAWLMELPGVTQAWTGMAGAPALTALGLVAALSGAPTVVEPPPPDEIAFESPTSSVSTTVVDIEGDSGSDPNDETEHESSTSTTEDVSSAPSVATDSADTTTPADTPVPTTSAPPSGNPTTAAPPSTTSPTTTSPTTTPPTTAAPTTAPPTTATPTPCELLRRGDYDDLIGTDLSLCDLRGLTIDGIDLSHADLTGADLTDATVSNFNLNGASLNGATLTGADLSDGSLVGASGTGINARGLVALRVDFASTAISGSDFTSSKLTDSSFGYAALSNVSFTDAEFAGVNFNDAVLRSVDFVRTAMPGAEFYRTDAKTSDFSNSTISAGRFDDADLSNTIFVGSSLVNATLQNAELASTSLNMADLSGSTGQPQQSEAAIYQDTVCPNGSVISVPSCWP